MYNLQHCAIFISYPLTWELLDEFEARCTEHYLARAIKTVNQVKLGWGLVYNFGYDCCCKVFVINYSERGINEIVSMISGHFYD